MHIIHIIIKQIICTQYLFLTLFIFTFSLNKHIIFNGNTWFSENGKNSLDEYFHIEFDVLHNKNHISKETN